METSLSLNYSSTSYDNSSIMGSMPVSNMMYRTPTSGKLPRQLGIRKQTEEVMEVVQTSESTNTSSDPMDEDTPRKIILKRKLLERKHKLESSRKKVRVLQQKVRRSIIKLDSLKSVIQDIQSQHLLSEDGLEMLKKSLPPETNQLLTRLSKNNKKKGGSYAPELRAFAMTLHFYSAAAYDYVREKFNLCLPNPRTIREWYSSVNGEPGFNSEAFKTLSLIASNANDTIDVALVVDDMSVKEHVEYDGKTVVGYVNMGTHVNDDSLSPATHACVYMVVGLKTRFRIPCAYFLIDSLTGTERANLTNQCIKKLHDVGIVVRTLTFDGCASNQKMSSVLNCDFEKLVTSFNHPCDVTKEISLFMDPCHMLKLIRNCLADKKITMDGDGNKIQWCYVEHLHSLQAEEGLKLGNKITQQHIQWYKKKMNVRLAAQTLSSSVADAIEFCDRILKLKQFEGSNATIKFIRMFDRLFDILNSRNAFARGYKASLNKNNIESVKMFLSEANTYIGHLKDDLGNLITKTQRKTGFIGFQVCIKSLATVYDSLVTKEKRLQYLLTYRMSQDSVELFFGCIRRHGGCNDNPTPRQFKAAYKKLLISNEVKMGIRGNCLNLTDVDILYRSSSRANHVSSFSTDSLIEYVDYILSGNTYDADESIDHDYCIDQFSYKLLSEYKSHVIPYIAGFVVRCVMKHISCFTCTNALTEDTAYALIKLKNNGGLIFPSRDVTNVCFQAEKCFLYHKEKYSNTLTLSKNINAIVLKVMKNVYRTAFHCLKDHVKDLDPLEHHLYLLIKCIIQVYLKIRMHHLTKVQQMKRSQPSIRNTLTRLIINKHQ